MRFGTTTILLGLTMFALSGCSGNDGVVALGSGGTDASGVNDGSVDTGSANDSGQPDSTPPGDAGVDVDAAGPHNRCPAAHGPRMAEIPSPDGGTFCIDTTEVTNAQYAEFLGQTGGNVPGPSQCAGHYEAPFVPECTYEPVTRPNLPVRCVPWCAAYSYCAWAGKRICGKVGGGAGSLDPSYANSSQSEWFVACSTNGANKYPTGQGVPGQCNDSSYHDGGALAVAIEDVGAAKGCHAATEPFSEINDLSGNVAEWEDACDGGPATCLVRGGSFKSIFLDTACGPGLTKQVTTFDSENDDPGIGIRCCAD